MAQYRIYVQLPDFVCKADRRRRKLRNALILYILSGDIQRNLASDKHDKFLQEIGVKLDSTPEGRYQASKQVWELCKKFMDDALVQAAKPPQPDLPPKQRARLPIAPSSYNSPLASSAAATQKNEARVRALSSSRLEGVSDDLDVGLTLGKFDFTQIAYERLKARSGEKGELTKREYYQTCGLLFSFKKQQARQLLAELISRFTVKLQGDRVVL